MTENSEKLPNLPVPARPAGGRPAGSGRKFFFGLFVFPLLIAVGMAVLLCSVVLLTTERETPESLITAIKTGTPSKRWQKAFELSNELNRSGEGLRAESVMREAIHILKDPSHYDPKTRGYMALVLNHFDHPEVIAALRAALDDESQDVQIYALWSLGALKAKESAQDIRSFLRSESTPLRKMAVYVLGATGNADTLPYITPLLEDPSKDIRWNAALSLARLGSAAGRAVLISMLDRESLSSGALDLSEAEIEKIMINAAKGLALIPDSESIKILRSVAREDKSLKVRQAAIDALNTQKEKI